MGRCGFVDGSGDGTYANNVFVTAVAKRLAFKVHGECMAFVVLKVCHCVAIVAASTCNVATAQAHDESLSLATPRATPGGGVAQALLDSLAVDGCKVGAQGKVFGTTHNGIRTQSWSC